jgi:hypothetical protein
MTQFKGAQSDARAQYDRQWKDAKSRLGFKPLQGNNKALQVAPGATGDEAWDLDRSNSAYGDALALNIDDFAGRGALTSGYFGQAQGQIARDFQNRLDSLNQGQSEDVTTQNRALQAFQGQQSVADRNALRDAVNRIAAKYGLDPSRIPQGTGATTITR